MNWILKPAQGRNDRRSVLGALLLLAFSAAALSVAPAMMPEGYSWIVHTTSQSAAQNLASAWIARLGFLSFGIAVMCLAAAAETMWARGVVWMHLSFAVLMISTAVFSHRPWVSGVPFDAIEDHLHSFTATAVGFAFAFGVLMRFLQLWGQGTRGRVLDLLALLSAALIPMVMSFRTDVAGLVQRIMFLVAYVWYAREALDLHGSSSARHETPPHGDRAALDHADQVDF